MKRKIMAVAVFLISAAVAGGCGNSGEERETDSRGMAKEDAPSTEDRDLYGFESPVRVKAGVVYAGDFEWVGKESLTDNSWMDLYKEHNIYPEIMYNVDTSQADSKLSSAIISGNYPDIFQTSTLNYMTYVNEGVLADITEAYETYASDELKEYLMSDGGEALDMLTVNGRLYGLPRLGNPYEEYSMMFIRQDWLDHLGLKVPETTEELKRTAHAFTYDDPDGNGVDDTCGLVLDGVELFTDTIGNGDPIFNAFGAYFGSDGMAMVENQEGEVVWGGSYAEGMKAALSFLQELYADGSLCKDFLTMDGDAIFEAAGSGRCGIWFGPRWAGMVPAIDAARKDTNAHIVAAPIPTAPNQARGKAYLPPSILEVHCISSQCERPETLIKMMNLSVQKICNPQNTEEFLKYSGDGTNYSGWKASLLRLQPVNRGYDDWKAESYALKTGKTERLTYSQIDDVDSMTSYLHAVEEDRFDPWDQKQARGISFYTVYGDPQCAWVTIDNMMKANDFVKSAYSSLPSREVTKTAGILKNLTVESIIKIITGDAVEEWDTLLENWYALGGQHAVDEVKVLNKS